MIDTLLHNYGKTSDEEMRFLLDKIKLVGYYEETFYTFNKSYYRKLIANLREAAFNMLDRKIKKSLDLAFYKNINFYVKSSSRFILKADMGEIFDQMSNEDKLITKAIYVDSTIYTVVPDTEGEDFIMEATLLL